MKIELIYRKSLRREKDVYLFLEWFYMICWQKSITHYPSCPFVCPQDSNGVQRRTSCKTWCQVFLFGHIPPHQRDSIVVSLSSNSSGFLDCKNPVSRSFLPHNRSLNVSHGTRNQIYELNTYISYSEVLSSKFSIVDRHRTF